MEFLQKPVFYFIRDTKDPLYRWPSRSYNMLHRCEAADFPALWFLRDSPSPRANWIWKLHWTEKSTIMARKLQQTSQLRTIHEKRWRTSRYILKLNRKNLCLLHFTNIVVSSSQLFVVQHCEVTMVNTQFSRHVASLETREGCPITPGASFTKQFYLVPLASSNKDRRGIALDGHLKVRNKLKQVYSRT